MAIPVIFSNSTAGKIEPYLLAELISKGKIVAYKKSGIWTKIDFEKEKDAVQTHPLPANGKKTAGLTNGGLMEGELCGSVGKQKSEDMDMLIRVIYKNNRRGMIDEYLLDELIKEDKIKAFRRSDGWAKIGRDPVREKWKSPAYKGKERRKDELPPDYFL